MGYSQAQKAENRERILALASAQIRAHGIDSLAIVPLMEAAALTHGGFYGHFASREALIAAAIEHALADGTAGGTRAKGGTLAEIARSYLSRRHRDTPQSGCAIAAIGGEIARADRDGRKAMTEHINAFIAGVRPHLADEDDAALAVSAMVGALMLSRLIADAEASDTLLKDVQRALARLERRSE